MRRKESKEYALAREMQAEEEEEEEKKEERERERQRDGKREGVYARCFTFHGASLKVAEHVFLNVLPGCREKERNP